MSQLTSKKATKPQQSLAAQLGFSLDTDSGTLYGVREGYHLCLSPVAGTTQYCLTASIAQSGMPPLKDDFKALNRMYKEIKSCTVTKNKLTVFIKHSLFWAKTNKYIQAAVDATVQYLRGSGYTECCETCGRTSPLDAYYVSGATMTLCPACYTQRASEIDWNQQKKQRRPENVLLGAVGALLGALVGAVVILIIARLGFVSMWAGVVMGVCTIKGYELLGGQFGLKGIVISALVMLAMVFLANQLDWAFTILEYYNVSFGQAFQGVSILLAEGAIDKSVYYGNLVMMYLFTGVGAVLAIIGAIKGQKLSNTVYKFGNSASQPTIGQGF